MDSPADDWSKSRRTRSSRDGNGTDRALLTSEDVRRPAVRIADGDVEARNSLVQANLNLVERVARQYVERGLSLDDLIGEGNLGLIRAAAEYDPGLGTSFSTYATYWIKEAILSALINTAATIRLPGNVFKMMVRWRKTEKQLENVHGRSPTFEEVAAAMGLDRPMQGLMAQAHRVARLMRESVVAEDGPRSAFRWRDDRLTHDEALAEEEERQWVFRRLERLAGPERAVVVLRFGLAGESPMSLSDIARRLGVTPDAVRKLAAEAIRKLGASREVHAASAGPAYAGRVG
jgi:RNA polymerase primary sigma factor